MNDYEMMEQRVDQLRLELGRLNQKKDNIQTLIDDVMLELLDTRRQITRDDKLKVKMGWFLEGYSKTFREDAVHQMNRLSTHISDIKWNDDSGMNFQSVEWMGIPKVMALVDYLDV